MKKNKITSINFITTAFILLLSSPIQAEDITVTAYYPSPSGEYKKIGSTDTTHLASEYGAVSIGTSAAAGSALLDIDSTSKGFLLPRLTTAQRNSIEYPVESLLIYNTDTRAVEYCYDPTAVPVTWKTITSGSGTVGDTRWESVGVSDLRTTSASASVGIGTKGISNVTTWSKLTIYNGSLLSSGTSGATPVSGAGTRFMWIPSKAAMRAGLVDGAQWDESNVGEFSLASGHNTIARGAGTISMGDSNEVGSASGGTGNHAVAMGWRNTVFGDRSYVFGSDNTVDGTWVPSPGADAVTLANALLIGRFFKAEAPGVTMIGAGRDVDNPLVATIPYSFYIGYGTTTPTFFINGDPDNAAIGSVGIGTTTPLAKLHIFGGKLKVENVVYTSDGRLKTDINPLHDALDKIRQIQPVYFRWKDKKRQESKRNVGVLAQEVEKFFPEIVTTLNDPEKHKAVDYGRLNVVLIEGIKELKAKNDALCERIAALKAAKKAKK